MPIETIDLVTENGDINILDRVGGRINLLMSDGLTEEDLSTLAIYFESGSISILMSDNGTGDKYVDITPAHITTFLNENSSRFAIIDKTATPDESLWEGYIFIRTVD